MMPGLQGEFCYRHNDGSVPGAKLAIRPRKASGRRARQNSAVVHRLGFASLLVLSHLCCGPLHADEALSIDGVGRVGIGKTTPAATLDVNGTGAFSGNVGIATTAPHEGLEIAGDQKKGGRAIVS